MDGTLLETNQMKLEAMTQALLDLEHMTNSYTTLNVILAGLESTLTTKRVLSE